MIDAIIALLSTTITLTLVGPKALHPLTLSTFHTSPLLAGGAHTSAFSFDGGDALCVVTGQCPNARTWVVLRVGNRVEVAEAAGLVPLLKRHGVKALVR